MKKILSIITMIAMSACFMSGCGGTSAEAATPEPDYNIDGPYTVTATITPYEDVYYYVGAQYIDADTEAAMINTRDVNKNETTISIVSKAGCTRVDVVDGTGAYAYYCDGNLLAEGEINALSGETIFSTFKNLLTDIVFKEDVAGSNGPFTHMISNLDHNATDISCEMDDAGKVSLLQTNYEFNGFVFDITYRPSPETPSMDLQTATKINKEDLVGIINTMADYMFYTTVQNDYTAKVPQLEPEEPEEPAEPEEPETLMVTQQVATLSDSKDLFIKVSFSDHVDNVEFTAPTGGTYKVENGNVEIMRDDDVTKDVFYRIANAEVGTWQITYDNAANDITVESVTDNKIGISDMSLSPIKDGIITVTPTLVMDKKLDINYEYHIDIIQDNKTVDHSSNILNTKTDKAKYNVSTMGLNPGVYKLRLRIEYEYDGQHYINMYSSDDFEVN